MEIRSPFKKEAPPLKASYHIEAAGRTTDSDKQNSETKFKGQTDRKQIKHPKDLGEAHPFNYAEVDKLYKNGGVVAAVVDKYVDYIWGNRFKVISKDDRAQELIKQWNRSSRFPQIGKQWVKEAVKKGTGFLELGKLQSGKEGIGAVKLLKSDYMYIKRDKFGKILKIIQYVGQFKENKFNYTAAKKSKELIEFDPDQIAIITINRDGSSPYGLGVIYPASLIIDNLLCAGTELHTLIKRKANSPIVAKLGSLEHQLIPTREDITAVGGKLQYLNNKHEWCVGPEVELSVLDFGNFGDKFHDVIAHDEKTFAWATQCPEVILGSGNIPEGLAKVHREIWQRTICSKQEDIEFVIEESIYSVVLKSNGIDVPVEIIWNEPSEEQIKNKITLLNEIVKNPFTAMAIKREAQVQLAELLEFDNVENIAVEIDSELKEADALKKKLMSEPNNPKNARGKEEGKPQPKVPGTKAHLHRLECGCMAEDMKTDYSLLEWLDFNYLTYLAHIVAYIDKTTFTALLAKTEEEIRLGKLSKKQVAQLRAVLSTGFTNQLSIKQIEKMIANQVNPPNAYYIDKAGKTKLAISSKYRSNAIARSETTRMASGGMLDFVKDEKGTGATVTFVSSAGVRTCEECNALNGQIYNVENAYTIIPVHSNCRCTWVKTE